jgi:hypothetical protein
MATLVDIPELKPPTLRVVRTVGDYFRVVVHGIDNLGDGERYAEMDIGRAATKREALKQARDWFRRMEDSTPKRSDR